MTTTPLVTQQINATYHAANAVGLNPATVGYVACTLAGAEGTTADTFTNTGREFLHVKCPTGNSDLIVTVDCDVACDHGFDHDVVFKVPATEERMVGPFPVAWFGSTVVVTYTGGSGGAAPTIAVFQLPARSPGAE
jgi:hypothetical protein